MTESNKN